MSESVAGEEDIERIARQLCLAAGKDPDRITALTFVPPHPREWMQFRDAAREALLAAREGADPLWHPITETPETMGDRLYIVSDGTYVEKALWNEKLGFYRIEGGESIRLDPQPTHWIRQVELLRLIPVQKVPLP
jgi:hypothetical protein